jgi:hypothetical protein
MIKASKASKSKGAGRASSGNVTVDLGEAIEKKIRDAGLRRTEVAGIPPSLRGRYRPGMYGGFRPWMGRFGHPRPWLGQESAVSTWRTGLIPVAIQSVKTTSVLTGLGVGLVGNRALVRVTPMLWKNDSKLLHEGLAFVAGLLPLLFKRTATTVGVAIPGLVYLGGSLVDLVMNAVGVPATALKGSEGAQRIDASMAARQRLAAIQQKIQAPRAPTQQRVVAQAF